ncbi:2-C-methyl-D-erythritol 2,4-cyclodiphosphate synthase [Helicobacter canis]|uniref:Bifunctional enzyme IspD/IspF n=1 Tax=Helicobacter canis TaxID=29419 RepID=A0A377J5S6_9HELI|nr:2-C-methyl-D-erythritol 2,4-cyclodiphosphate synthase [Helicobacter canis]STO97143.1 bifunctional 2-C-methyl-D-erythritol 4-phosphate cytidylyltransferase/2-C-methyl-D-erythritol 2,4-cyclodiphosphate synthase [Helicobacter canis]
MYRNTTQLQLDPTQATAPSESLVPQGASIALILMAAGSSSRFAQSSPKTHAIKKQWLRIGEKPLWLFVADTLSAMYPFVQIRITASEQEASYMQKLCSYEIVIGGETRQESLRNALQGIESEWVLVSDVARAGIVAVARKIISALIVTSLDSRDKAQTQSKQRAASLEKVDSRGNVDCHAAAHAAARNDREIATSEKVDSRDNAQNLNNSQAEGLCGNNTEAQNVFCSQLAGGRIFLKKHRFARFDEKAGLCSGEQGDKTWASIDAASHKLPAFSQKANAQNTQVDCVAPILAVPDTAIYNESYIDRSKLFRVQTPQLSRVSALRAALESTQDQGTDESSIIKANGGIVRYIQGDRALEKLTLASDMAALEQILGQAQSWQHAAPFAPMPTLRVGNGLDVHSFEIGKVMKLGGVVIESEFGFKAHSDGDVALHSVIDAILGAMGAGDIGEWFPDSSSAWEGADSARLLEIVWGFARSVGYELCNLDLTIIAQKPRLGAYKQPIRARIAEILGVPLSAINVKATTTEQLGFVGRAEGVCAMSSVCLRIVSFAEVAQSYQLYKG